MKNFSFLLENWKTKYTITVGVSVVLVLISWIIEDEYYGYITFGSIYMIAALALVWVVPTTVILIILEPRIPLIRDTFKFKKSIIKFYQHTGPWIRVILQLSTYLILVSLWNLAIFLSLISLEIVEGG